MKYKKYVLPVLTVAISLMSAPVIAAELDEQVPPSEAVVADEMVAIAPPPCPMMECREDFINSLSLSDSQLEKIADLRDRLQEASAQKRADLKSLRHQLGELMTQPTINRAKITELADKMNALKTELSNTRLAFFMDSAEVLTSDQRKQLRHRMLEHQLPFGGQQRHGLWRHHKQCDR